MPNSERKLPVKDADSKDSKGFIAGAIIGSIIGAGIALFLAPKAGRELRSTITSEVESLKEKTGQIRETAVTKGTELVEKAKKRSQTITDTVAKQSADMINKIKKENSTEDEFLNVTEFIHEVNPQNNHIKQMLDETKKAFDETERQLNK